MKENIESVTPKEEAVKRLSDFVNDHNETVRWLRNQSPDEVAEALAAAITQERRRVWEKAVGAVRKNQMDKSSEFRVQPNPHDEWWCRGWNSARFALQSAMDEELKETTNE